MAKAPPSPPSRTTTETAPAPSAEGLTHLTSHWLLLGFVGLTLVVNGAAFYWFRVRTVEPPPPASRDIAVGTFEYSRFDAGENRFQRGQFDLSVRAIENLGPAHAELLQHQEQRFQQAVEETLRRMRAVDFNDPHLIRLRARIQQRLNEELGFDWVEEVEVSNQLVERPRREMPAEPHGKPVLPDSSPGE